MEQRRRGTTRFASLALAAVALAAVAAPAGSTARSAARPMSAPTGAPFCSSPIVDNYWEPIEKLKPIPAVPEAGVLPFAPPWVTLGATGPRLLIGPSNVGFRLTNGAPAGRGARRLNWTVLERLIRFTHDGHGVRPAGLGRINLKKLPAGAHRGLVFPIPATPAVYSLEITIQNHRGRLLGRFGEYLRVVARTVSVGITLAAYDKVAPGSYLESCFENHGSAAVTPTATGLERFDGSSWRPVPVGPRYTPAQSPIQRTLGPGEAERIAVLVPSDARPGLYRLDATGTTELGEPVTTIAEFGVL